MSTVDSNLPEPMLRRALSLWAFRDLNQLGEPMIWITGPRQSGKTYLTHQFFRRTYNWDTVEVKKAFLSDPYFFRDLNEEQSTVVFDEIHKRKNWKSLLKGYYDSKDRKENFVVTGSGRFDLYKKGGDSLQGRYFMHHLWPLLFDEVVSDPQQELHLSIPRDWKTWNPLATQSSDQELYEFGGFPKPFLKKSKTYLNRWCDQYIQKLTQEDVRDFATIHDVEKLELLARLLPTRVGSPLSEKSLSEDVEVAPATIKNWLKLLETLYLGFSVPAFHKKIHRAVKKERKWFFFQWAFCEDDGARFENYLAVQLAAACSAWRDQGFGKWELNYLRDQDRREIDFILVKNGVPQCLIEAKYKMQEWPSALSYYSKKLKIPAFFVYKDGPTRKHELGYQLSSAAFLRGLVIGV